MALIEKKLIEVRECVHSIELPGKIYDPISLANEGYERTAVGLVLLRFNQLGNVEIIMGKHRESERSIEESGRWSWLAETVREREQGQDIAYILARLVPEEMDRGLIDLDLYAGNKVIYETNLIKEGMLYKVPVYTFWTTQDLDGPNPESEEIEYLKSFPLEPLTRGIVDENYPLREFTIEALQQLVEQGAFTQTTYPTTKVTIPPQYQVNGYKVSPSLDLTRYKTS